MEDTVANYVLIPFEGSISHVDPLGIKLHLQSTKDIDKEAGKFGISVSNSKYIIDNFLSLANKYFLIRLAFMVDTGAGTNNIFIQV